jgi:predicted DCC family thiol-disulfide oxidoreductase YuxK
MKAAEKRKSAGGSVCLLYDGACPFCRVEARWLGRRNEANRLELKDFQEDGFEAGAYGLDRSDIEAGLHAILPGGRVVTRMDAVRAAYASVGLGWLLAPTRWSGLRWLFDRAYDVFARNRRRWGQWVRRGR